MSNAYAKKATYGTSSVSYLSIPSAKESKNNDEPADWFNTYLKAIISNLDKPNLDKAEINQKKIKEGFLLVRYIKNKYFSFKYRLALKISNIKCSLEKYDRPYIEYVDEDEFDNDISQSFFVNLKKDSVLYDVSVDSITIAEDSSYVKYFKNLKTAVSDEDLMFSKFIASIMDNTIFYDKVQHHMLELFKYDYNEVKETLEFIYSKISEQTSKHISAYLILDGLLKILRGSVDKDEAVVLIAFADLHYADYVGSKLLNVEEGMTPYQHFMKYAEDDRDETALHYLRMFIPSALVLIPLFVWFADINIDTGVPVYLRILELL